MEDLDRNVDVFATGDTVEAALEMALTDQGQDVATVGVNQLEGSVSAMPNGDGTCGSRERLGRTRDDVALRSWRSAPFVRPRPRWRSGPPGLHLARNIVSHHHLHGARSASRGSPLSLQCSPSARSRVLLGSPAPNGRETG